MTLGSQPDWDVFLIGGHSTSGKSTVARKLGRRFDVPVSQIDDYRIALQRATRPGQAPHSPLASTGVALWAVVAQRSKEGRRAHR